MSWACESKRRGSISMAIDSVKSWFGGDRAKGSGGVLRRFGGKPEILKMCETDAREWKRSCKDKWMNTNKSSWNFWIKPSNVLWDFFRPHWLGAETWGGCSCFDHVWLFRAIYFASPMQSLLSLLSILSYAILDPACVPGCMRQLVFGISCEVLLHPSLSSILRLLRSNTFITLSLFIGYIYIYYLILFDLYCFKFFISYYYTLWYMIHVFNHLESYISVTILMVSISRCRSLCASAFDLSPAVTIVCKAFFEGHQIHEAGRTAEHELLTDPTPYDLPRSYRWRMSHVRVAFILTV